MAEKHEYFQITGDRLLRLHYIFTPIDSDTQQLFKELQEAYDQAKDLYDQGGMSKAYESLYKPYEIHAQITKIEFLDKEYHASAFELNKAQTRKFLAAVSQIEDKTEIKDIYQWILDPNSGVRSGWVSDLLVSINKNSELV